MPSKKSNNPFDTFIKNVEDDCERPACEDTISALSEALNRIKETPSEVAGASDSLSCPPTKDAIGNSSWTLLHSMAAWYPQRPTSDEQSKMKNFIEALSMFYPCTYCAEDFRENLKNNPVKTESREDLSLWLCEQHNLVNQKLVKPLFKCDIKIIDARWRKSGDPRCGA